MSYKLFGVSASPFVPVAMDPNNVYIWVYSLLVDEGLEMKLSECVKPISYLKSHTAQALREVSNSRQTMVITQHGEAKAVLQDIDSYEKTQESLAMLKLLAQSTKSKGEGRVKSAKKAFADVRKRVRNRAG